jgi:hypothetical protein
LSAPREGLAVAQTHRLIDGLPIQGLVHHQTRALIRPHRLRIPLIGELDLKQARSLGVHQGEARVAPHLLGQGAV